MDTFKSVGGWKPWDFRPLPTSSASGPTVAETRAWNGATHQALSPCSPVCGGMESTVYRHRHRLRKRVGCPPPWSPCAVRTRQWSGRSPFHDCKSEEVDPEGDYIEAMLPEWKPSEAVDLIHTMECLYYLNDPLGFLHTLHNDWLRPGGRMVIGVDHYQENPSSHDRGPSLNVHMALLSMNEGLKGWKKPALLMLKPFRLGPRKDGWHAGHHGEPSDGLTKPTGSPRGAQRRKSPM